MLPDPSGGPTTNSEAFREQAESGPAETRSRPGGVPRGAWETSAKTLSSGSRRDERLRAHNYQFLFWIFCLAFPGVSFSHVPKTSSPWEYVAPLQDTPAPEFAWQAPCLCGMLGPRGKHPALLPARPFSTTATRRDQVRRTQQRGLLAFCGQGQSISGRPADSMGPRSMSPFASSKRPQMQSARPTKRSGTLHRTRRGGTVGRMLVVTLRRQADRDISYALLQLYDAKGTLLKTSGTNIRPHKSLEPGETVRLALEVA